MRLSAGFGQSGCHSWPQEKQLALWGIRAVTPQQLQEPKKSSLRDAAWVPLHRTSVSRDELTCCSHEGEQQEREHTLFLDDAELCDTKAAPEVAQISSSLSGEKRL